MGSTTIHSFRYRRLAARLRTWREQANQTQRSLGAKLRKPASYVHKCEVAERKIDPFEFMEWLEACDVDPAEGLAAVEQLRRGR